MTKESLVPLVNLVQTVKLALLVTVVIPDSKDLRVPSVLLVFLEPLVKKVTAESLVLKELLELSVLRVPLDHPDLKVSLV